MRRTNAGSLRLTALGVALTLCRPCVAESRELRLLGTSHLGGDLYLSNARTQGGIGGGLGARLSWRDRWLLEMAAGFLAGAGQVETVSLSVGVQRSGTYRPALLVGPHILFGDAMHFLTPQHRRVLRGPAFSVGVTLVPVRFRLEDTELTLGALYLGVGSDLPGVGLAYGISLFEVGVSL